MAVSLGASPTPSNFPGGFANGVNVRGMPVLNAYPGKVFWVNSSYPSNSDSNRGTFDRPFATLGGAVAAAANGGSQAPMAARGDIIMVGAGHSETISSATALTLSISGLQFVGLGIGALRPTITLDTATSSTINVTAGQISLTNMLFVANFAAIVSLFTLTTAKDFGLFGCEFKDKTSILNFKWIVNTDTTSNDSDGLTIDGCFFNGLGATANTALINMQQTMDRLWITNNRIQHAATTQSGIMPIAAGKVVTNMLCQRNISILSGAVAGVGVLVSTNQTTNTGMFADNYTTSLETSPVLCTASSGFKYMNNYYADAADLQGYLVPGADS